MKIQASKDYLTQVLNYREFDNLLNTYLKKVKESQFNFSIALIDLDGFKKVNDVYGYSAGDKIIKDTASLIRENVRNTDFIFRYKTGDEFAVVYRGVIKDGAKKAAERLRLIIKENPFTINRKEVRLTASIGLVSLSEGNISKNLLINKLEDSLQQAKEKNDTVVAS